MFIPVLFIIARNWNQLSCPSTEERIQKMWHICTMEYYTVIKNNDCMKFTGKWMELENIILSEVTQTQKNTHGVYSLISGFAQKLTMPIIQSIDHMELRRKKD
jgi:nitrogenase subunit NifH